jgi:hypothetical protein
MAFIPRQAKAPARIPITCKVPEMSRHCSRTVRGVPGQPGTRRLRVAFRPDQEFQAWLAIRQAAVTPTPVTTTAASSRQREEKEPAGGSFPKGTSAGLEQLNGMENPR